MTNGQAKRSNYFSFSNSIDVGGCAIRLVVASKMASMC